MRYFVLILITLCNISAKGQDAILIELKNETIDGFEFPIKIGGVFSDLNSKEVGTVYIPEFNKYYPLKFKDSIDESIANYLAFIQSDESFVDTVYLNIKQLEIKEELKLDIEESHLNFSVDFIRLKDGQKQIVSTYTEKVMISDPNVTLFHEYNVRLAISKSLKWFTTQEAFDGFKTEIIGKSSKRNKSDFIQTTNNPKVFIHNNTLVYNFENIEEASSKLNNKKINNLIRKHKVKQSIGTIFAGVGLFSGIVGYGISKYGDETQGGKILASGILSFLIGNAIWSSGERRYQSELIRHHNKVVLENNMAFAPYNPINLSLNIPLKKKEIINYRRKNKP